MRRFPPPLRWIITCLCLLVFVRAARAQSQPTSKPLADIPFEREILGNGLTVLYIPLHTAPVVHVRVIYHVGSRDENPQRQCDDRHQGGAEVQQE